MVGLDSLIYGSSSHSTASDLVCLAVTAPGGSFTATSSPSISTRSPPSLPPDVSSPPTSDSISSRPPPKPPNRLLSFLLLHLFSAQCPSLSDLSSPLLVSYQALLKSIFPQPVFTYLTWFLSFKSVHGDIWPLNTGKVSTFHFSSYTNFVGLLIFSMESLFLPSGGVYSAVVV